MTFLTTPNYGSTAGSLSALSDLLTAAKTNNTRIAIIGDSQEDVIGGDNFCDDLSQACFSHIGKCNETVISQPYNYGTALATQPLGWLTNVSMDSNAAASVPASHIPPGRSVSGQTPYTFYNFRTMVNFRADNAQWQGANAYRVLDPAAGYIGETYLYTSTAGSAACLWVHQKMASRPGSFFGTAVSSGAFSNVLNGSDWSPVRAVTPSLTHDPAVPYDQLIVGHNVNSGIQMAGTRMIGQADTGGIVWQSFGVSGYNTTHIGTNHTNAGPMFRLMGGASGWNAIAIGLCNNNAFVLEQTKAQYKTAISNLITLLRTWNGNNNTLMLLISDPPVTGAGWPAGALAKFNEYEDAQYELATELALVVSINSKRLMYDAGYDPANATYSGDGLHPTQLGAKLRSEVMMKQMFSLTTVGSVSSPTVSEIVSAINADATQTTARANAATAVAQTTQAAIKSGARLAVGGRWTNLGTAANRDDISVGDIP